MANQGPSTRSSLVVVNGTGFLRLGGDIRPSSSGLERAMIGHAIKLLEGLFRFRFNFVRRTVPLISSKCSGGGFLRGAPCSLFLFHACVCVFIAFLLVFFAPSIPPPPPPIESISGSPSHSIHLTELTSAPHFFNSISSPCPKFPCSPRNLHLSGPSFSQAACPVPSTCHTPFSLSTPPRAL